MKFGGINGTLGETWSWVFGAFATLAACWAMWSARKNKVSHGFPVKPVGAEYAMMALVGAGIMGFIWILNSYQIPTARLKRMFAANGEEMPEGFTAAYGLPISVLLLIAVAIIMTVVARKTRLGRYIFATGGNLCAVSAVVASARLTNHSNDIGTLDELRVIAAAVIGGTALSGGLGTIHGAILGALIMQSLQSGMAMVGVDAPLQNIVVGSVLVAAVLIDITFRKRAGLK